MSVHLVAALAVESQAELLRYACGLCRDEHLALDAYQEALVRAIEHIDDIRDHRKLVGWMRTTIRHLIFESKRRKQPLGLDTVTEVPTGDEDGGPAWSYPPEDGAEWVREARERLSAVQSRLTPAAAEFLGAVLEHRTPDAIRAVTGMPSNIFRMKLSRLRADLAELAVVAADHGAKQGYLPYTSTPPDDPYFPLAAATSEAIYQVMQSGSRLDRASRQMSVADKLKGITSDEARLRGESLLAGLSLLFLCYVRMLPR